MPYIDKAARNRLEDGGIPVTAGELNYKITMLLHDYIDLKNVSYQTFNDILGALEGAKLELYRRYVAPYEDFKKGVNGDVP